MSLTKFRESNNPRLFQDLFSFWLLFFSQYYFRKLFIFYILYIYRLSYLISHVTGEQNNIGFFT